MILDDSILIKRPRGISVKYYKDLGYDVNSDEILIKIEHLSKGSGLEINVRCDYCGVDKKSPYYDYNKTTKNGSTKYACSKCSCKKYKESCLERWGVDNYFQLESFKNDMKSLNMEKYGVEFHTQSDKVKNKIKEVVKKKYGVENISQVREVKEKVTETNIKKYGHKRYRSNFKIDNDPDHVKYISDSNHLFKCKEGHEFEITNSNYWGRFRGNTPLCTICNPIGDNRSIKEGELYQYISSIYGGEIIQSYRDGLEIDIYLPDLKLGFEFNGVHWHSDKFLGKNYHQYKSKYFGAKGIKIFHIWEDDWVFKKEIIKSMIVNGIGKTKNRINARECSVSFVDDIKLIKDFLDKNHIQGYTRSKYKIGLFYKGELVSLMTFDQFEGRKKIKDGFNLNRFCNKLETNVIGGASKLFNYFKKKFEYSRIISYADKDWSYGDLYKKLGFSLLGESNPDYKYVLGERRIHKSRFRKSKTGVSESKLEIPKIWDCGKLKFEFLTKFKDINKI